MDSLPTDLKLNILEAIIWDSLADSFRTLHAFAQLNRSYYALYLSRSRTLLNRLARTYIQPSNLLHHARCLSSLPEIAPNELLYAEERGQVYSRGLGGELKPFFEDLFRRIRETADQPMHAIDSERAILFHKNILFINKVREEAAHPKEGGALPVFERDRFVTCLYYWAGADFERVAWIREMSGRELLTGSEYTDMYMLLGTLIREKKRDFTLPFSALRYITYGSMSNLSKYLAGQKGEEIAEELVGVWSSHGGHNALKAAEERRVYDEWMELEFHKIMNRLET